MGLAAKHKEGETNLCNALSKGEADSVPTHTSLKGAPFCQLTITEATYQNRITGVTSQRVGMTKL